MKGYVQKAVLGVVMIAILVAVSPFAPAAQEGRCDRDCLIGLVDRYLEALAAHDPAGLPLSESVRFTEDTAELPVGDGLWVGASEVSDTFRIYAADAPAGQVGFYGVVYEFGRPALLALRLRVEHGLITEIEHVLARNMDDAAMANLRTPRPAFLEPVPPGQRNSRAEMYLIAHSYFDSIEQSDGDVAPFAGDCIRHENGVRTTSQEPPDPDDYGDSPADRMRYGIKLVDALNCEDQIEAGNLAYITRIRPRRLVIIDEELGLVYGFPMFVHRGDARMVKITGVAGVDSIPKAFGPINLQAGEIFKIYGGEIHEIEANGFLLPYNADSGWDE